MDFSLRPPVDDDHAPAYDGRSRYGAPQKSRYVSALLALVVCGLLGLVLLSMAALTIQPDKRGAVLSAIKLIPPPPEQQKAHAGAKSKPKSTVVPHEAQAALKQPPHVQINNPNKVEWPDGFIHMSHADLANSDISKYHSAAPGGNGDANGGGGGHGGDDGPGSSRLYNAAWYREPSNNALAGYMRPGQSPGRWAEIKCRTIENYHVEDCQELGEEPRGSGMARVLREAAWQFLVRPPRVDGKSLIGTWVRIHYDFHEKVVTEPREGAAIGD
jgi:protein TonB